MACPCSQHHKLIATLQSMPRIRTAEDRRIEDRARAIEYDVAQGGDAPGFIEVCDRRRERRLVAGPPSG
jgi:hypothetical protein